MRFYDLAVALSAAAALTACATAAPPAQPQKQAWPTGAAPASSSAGPSGAPARPAPPRADDPALLARRFEANPTTWARGFRTAVECEAAARRIRTLSDAGWRALKACASAKGEFKVFERLTDGFWDADLRARPDAALVLGPALATRGGDLVTDLADLRKRKIPLFALETAVAYPDIYKGRTVVFIGRVDQITPQKAAVEVALAEQALLSRATSSELVQVGGSSYRGQDEHGRAYSQTYGGELAYRNRYSNALEDTGKTIIGRIPRADPFFEPGRTFLVVGRFTGLVSNEQTVEDAPAVSIDGYFELGEHTME